VTASDDPDVIVLQSVRVRARAESSRDVGELTRRALTGARWPSAPADEVVVVRRLRVRGRLGEIGAAAGRALERALALGTECVRFSSRETMVAELSTAIALGRGGEWPWQALLERTARAASDELCALWSAHPLQLQEIWARIVASGHAPRVLHALEPADAERVAAIVAHATSLPLPRGEPAASVAAPTQRPPSPLAQIGDSSSLSRQAYGLVAGFSPDDPRVRLAAFLQWIRSRPQALRTPDAPKQFARWCAQLVGPEVVVTADEAGRDAPHDAARGAAAAPRAGDDEAQMAAGERDLESPTAKLRVESAMTGSTPLAGRRLEPVANGASAAAPERAADELASEVATEHAGTFRLVCFLERREAQATLAESGWWRDHGRGFGLLQALVRSLGLPPQDPLDALLAGLVAAETQVDDVPEPPPSLVESLLSLGPRLYGNELFGPSLLRARGRVKLTPSRIDVVLPGSAVDLELRLAGLDLDPGFVPWLGRIVRFHYRFDEGRPS